MAEQHLVRIVLPFRLPSWNNLLSVHRWRRKKLRDLLDRCALSLQVTSDGSEMPTVLRPSTSSMPSWMRDYSKAMGQKSSSK